ncbi:hypothetical protein [Solirubrobacter soli]|uniref:hypothetical protein n=1 Tax=Solirubrobacter soli TaxID=363832 RepID=UPI000483B995|nr:hypothetical protein [Solirubrobacter soli]
MKRLRCSRGQTSAELLGVLALVCLIVVAILASGAGPKISDGIQCAVTRITGGTCTDDLTGPNGEPLISECVRNASQRGIAGSIRVAAFDFGGGVEGTNELRADGTVKVTIKGNAKAGLNWGVDVGIKAGDTEAGVGAGGRAGVTATVARAWIFDSEADADRFVSDVKKKVGAIANPLPNFPGTKDDADIKLPPHDESTIQGGLELRQKAGASGVQTLERNVSVALGRTVNTNADDPNQGDTTYYFEVAGGAVQDTGLGDLEKEKLMLFKIAASGQANLRLAYTIDKNGQPKTLRATGQLDVTAAGDVSANLKDFEGTKFNTVLDRLTKRKEAQNGALGGRAIVDFKLDLRDPANREAALGFVNGVNSAGQPVSRLSSMIDLGGRLLTDSTFNARFYSLAKQKTSVGFNAGVFGVSGEYTSEDATLVDAFYRPAGGDTFGFTRWDSCVH